MFALLGNLLLGQFYKHSLKPLLSSARTPTILVIQFYNIKP